jgi:superoxide dismutase, Fe-Mn family
MNQAPELSRRQALKALSAGAAMLALGSIQAQVPAETVKASGLTPPPKAPAPQPFVLPQVDFPYEALEPYIDARTMEIHHTKHHQAYIDAANRALAEFPKWQKLTAEELLKTLNTLPEQIRTAVRNQVGGHVNHSQFWDILAPRPQKKPGKNLGSAIEHYFGSFDSFKIRFVDTGMKRFGSGWVWLSQNVNSQLEVHSTPNQDSPLLTGMTPMIGIDVWEHAYYLHYQNRRLDYLEGVWNVLNWAEADARFDKAASAAGT